MINIFLKIWNDVLISNLFNFLIMLLLLGWIFNKFKIADMLEDGRKRIEDSITTAKETKENSIKTLFKTQEDGVKIEKEAVEIIEKSLQNAVIVGEKLVEDAKIESDGYSKAVQRTIDTNIKNLKKDITTETAQKALNMAKNHIENELKKDRSLHIKYINESIETLKDLSL